LRPFLIEFAKFKEGGARFNMFISRLVLKYFQEDYSFIKEFYKEILDIFNSDKFFSTDA
jgi:hypothetical protein